MPEQLEFVFEPEEDWNVIPDEWYTIPVQLNDYYRRAIIERLSHQDQVMQRIISDTIYNEGVNVDTIIENCDTVHFHFDVNDDDNLRGVFEYSHDLESDE